MLETSPHGQRQAPARGQNARHLSESGRPIRKKLQPLLAAYDIEAGIWEGQRRCVAFVPRDGNARRSRHSARGRQHSCIEIKPGHAARGADMRCSVTRDRSGSTGDIEHAVAIFRSCDLDKGLRPGVSECRHDVAFVCPCNSFVGKLPA